MAIEHAHEHVYGIQWHPEVLHEEGLGRSIIERILALVGQRRPVSPRGAATAAVPKDVSWHGSPQGPLREAVHRFRRWRGHQKAASGGCKLPVSVTTSLP